MNNMQCPIDQTTLMMTERQGIEIDYCPECRGVWLDRGELDKLIEAGAGSRPVAAPPQQQYRDERPQQQYDDRRYKEDQYYKKKKKESFLSDLFDF
jgi:Zn-finger nucleic acid-binding protein